MFKYAFSSNVLILFAYFVWDMNSSCCGVEDNQTYLASGFEHHHIDKHFYVNSRATLNIKHRANILSGSTSLHKDSYPTCYLVRAFESQYPLSPLNMT